MTKLKDLNETGKLYIAGFSLLMINLGFYICLLYSASCFIDYDLFHKTVPLDLRMLFAPIAFCAMLLCLLLSYFVVDSEAEPVFKIFGWLGRFDFYFRLCVVVITFILIKTTINVGNKSYLYWFVFLCFCMNFYLESTMRKIIANTTEEEIRAIREQTNKSLPEECIKEYKAALKGGKISFFVICSTVLFHYVLKSTFATFIFFMIYSAVVLYLLRDIYFLLYENTEAIKKLGTKTFIMILGFILVLLLNEKIIVFPIYKFSPQELISMVGFFSFPLYYPTRKVYLTLRRSGEI